MKDLFDQARQYGLVDLFTGKNGMYSVNITFYTIENTELIARSGFGFTDPEEALRSAIKAAHEIVESVSNLKQNLICNPKAGE